MSAYVSPENETFKYAYDKLYRLIELDSGKVSEKTSYSYDALGRIIEEKRTDSTTSNSFDAAGQLLEMSHSRNSSPAEIIASRKYLYDLAGNRISMTDETNKVTSYAYDNSNWLTQAVYSNNDTVSYTYNGAGDRLTEKLNNDAAINIAYDAAGRIVAKGDEAFEYDDDGNLLRDNEAFYTWNSDNRLIVVEKTLEGCRHDKYKGYGYGHLKHGKTIVAYEEYSYLPQDWRRTERKLTRYVPQNNGKGNDNTTKEESTFISIYDGNDESHEYLLSAVTDKKNNLAQTELKLVREFVNGPGTDDIAFTRYGLISLTMLKDGLGSIIALSGPEAQTIARVGYDAWGEFRWSGDEEKAPCALNGVGPYLEQMQNTRNFGKTAHNSWNFGRHFASELSPYLYTGRRFSDFTGQYNNRNRYYSPALGRFISKDPIGFNGGMNLYRYADNNPVLFTDPFGLDPQFYVLQNPFNPNQFYLFDKGTGTLLNSNLTYSEAEEITDCDALFSNSPGGMSDSEKLEWILREGAKVGILHAGIGWIQANLGEFNLEFWRQSGSTSGGEQAATPRIYGSRIGTTDQATVRH